MAKLNDKETLSIARAVSDVLEGKQEAYHGKKKKEQYDSDKDHNMDPTSHVKKDEKTGMYCVYNVKGKKVAEFKTKAEADAYSKKNHDALMKEGPEEPRAKGEKEFKDKHVIKKSGENPDGTVTKEAKVVLTDEEKYKEFFARALEKFGVKSPAELDKEKRKEFFNYVDKNYKGVDEVLGVVKKAAKSVGRKIDKAVGTDLSGDKKAEIKQKLKDIDAKMDKHGTAIDNSKADLKAGKIDRSKQASIEDYHQTAMRNLEIEQDKLEAQLSGKKESVDEGLIDTIRNQLANLKKKKDSGNSSMDDATITKIAGLLQKKARAAQEMEKLRDAADKEHSKARDAEDRGDDGSDNDARAFDLDQKADRFEEKIEEIDDQIQKLKKGASKSEDVKEYGNVMSKKMKMRKDKEVHASYGKK